MGVSGKKVRLNSLRSDRRSFLPDTPTHTFRSEAVSSRLVCEVHPVEVVVEVLHNGGFEGVGQFEEQAVVGGFFHGVTSVGLKQWRSVVRHSGSRLDVHQPCQLREVVGRWLKQQGGRVCLDGWARRALRVFGAVGSVWHQKRNPGRSGVSFGSTSKSCLEVVLRSEQDAVCIAVATIHVFTAQELVFNAHHDVLNRGPLIVGHDG